MNIKNVLLVATLLAVCFALPPRATESDLSMFFDHTDASSRIIGGTRAAAGSHPHMVVLTTGVFIRSLLCGGSLVTERTILTAAHCISHVYNEGALTISLRATVGTNRWNSGGNTYNLSRNVTHPNYDSATIKNDIGFLITSSNVALGNHVRAVPITYSFVGEGVRATVAGWGRTSASEAISEALLELSPTTLEGNDCVTRVAKASQEFRIPVYTEPNIEVCTYHSPGFGACNGDSGSALTRADNGRQFGLVSWGFPCARGAPDVFVRISAYKSWLQANVV